MRLPRGIRDKSGNTLRSDDDARIYVLEKLKAQGNYHFWQRAARLVLDEASLESITQQIELALLLCGDLDVEFAANEALKGSKVG